MINIQFKLRDSESEDKTSIRCTFYHNNKRFMYSLGEDKKIYPELWDKKSMRPINSRNKFFKTLIHKYNDKSLNIEFELKNIHQRIENVTIEIVKYINHVEIQNKNLSFDDLRHHLHLQFNGVENSKDEVERRKITLNEYISIFIDEINSGKRTTTSKNGEKIQYAKTSVTVYREFEKQFRIYQLNTKILDFNDIDMNFYNQYLEYCFKNGNKINTIGKQIKCLKAIMNAALDQDLHNNNKIHKKDFKTIKTDVQSIYLNMDELKLIEEFDLSSKPHLEQVRDIFLCGCYTALRYSDYSRLSSDFLVFRDGSYYIEMITIKTKKRVIIPAKPIVLNILQKYNNKLPKSYEQKINKYIKQVAQMCGINTEVETKTIEEAKVKTSFIPKYKLITTHTARRTAATLLYKNGVRTLDIMKITGHTTEKMLLDYIKINVEENADRLKDNPFFR